MHFFGRKKILWVFFRGHHKIGLYLGVISMHLGSFFKVKVQNGGTFLGSLKFQIFLGCIKFLILFFVGGGGETVDAGPEPTYDAKMRVPPPPWGLRRLTWEWVRGNTPNRHQTITNHRQNQPPL